MPNVEVAYPRLSVRNGLGEYLSSMGLTQLRIAETEKYAHVTFFFNGGVETQFPGEDRVLVPSPQGGDLRSSAGDERRRGGGQMRGADRVRRV